MHTHIFNTQVAHAHAHTCTHTRTHTHTQTHLYSHSHRYKQNMNMRPAPVTCCLGATLLALHVAPVLLPLHMWPLYLSPYTFGPVAKGGLYAVCHMVQPSQHVLRGVAYIVRMYFGTINTLYISCLYQIFKCRLFHHHRSHSTSTKQGEPQVEAVRGLLHTGPSCECLQHGT